MLNMSDKEEEWGLNTGKLHFLHFLSYVKGLLLWLSSEIPLTNDWKAVSLKGRPHPLQKKKNTYTKIHTNTVYHRVPG